MTSVEGKTNKSGIRFRDNNIHWILSSNEQGYEKFRGFVYLVAMFIYFRYDMILKDEIVNRW